MDSKQSSLTSFFKPKKRPVEPELSPPVEPVKQRRVTGRISGYSYGGPGGGGGDGEKESDGDLRERFREKFKKPGSIEVIKDRRRDKGSEGDEEDAPKKLKGMDQQYVDFKKNNLDTILLFEVGYRCIIYGEDALKATRVLGWGLGKGKLSIDGSNPHDKFYDSYASCSFPVHNIPLHTKRLVNHGYKVGVVRQVETAAIKAAGNNKSGPFVRELTELYTKGTLLDNIQGGNDFSGGYILSICQDDTSTSTKVKIGIMAVQVSTGDVIADSFTDTQFLNELETRIIHINPVEILIIGEVSPLIRKMANEFASRKDSRLEECPMVSDSECVKRISVYFNSPQTERGSLRDPLISSTPQVRACMVALLEYLKPFQLDNVFELATSFKYFGSLSHMTLSATTLRSLEIFENASDFSCKGSLFWVLDQTQTGFGRRLLKKWISRPLLNKNRLEARVASVTEISKAYTPLIEKVVKLMRSLPDLETGLTRIHYQRCSRKDIWFILHYLNELSCAVGTEQHEFKARPLVDIFATIPTCRESTEKFLSKINKEAALKDDKETFFVENEASSEDIVQIVDEKMLIAEVEKELNQYLIEMREKTGLKYIKYVTLKSDTHLIEVRTNDTKKIPQDWIKFNGTKTVARFRTPEILSMLKRLNLHQERLIVCCDVAFKNFLSDIDGHYETFRKVINALAEFDCLKSLAALACTPGYICPEFVDYRCIDVKQGRHPIVEVMLQKGFIANDIALGPNDPNTMIITGPNMGGKSSYVKQVALISIMAQIGSYVPALSAKLGLVDSIHTRMGAYDNMLTGESTFMVELKECSDIMRSATKDSLIILDEIGRGTGTMDGVAIAYAILSYFVQEINPLLLFITHYPSLASIAQEYPSQVTNYHMGFLESKSEAGTTEITFLYTLKSGVAHRSYGLNVARLAGIQGNILDRARVISHDFELKLRLRELTAYTKRFSVDKGN